MEQVRRIAQRHQLFVVEDASEAHGAEYRGARVGGVGGCAAFSFYGNKIVTTGEGGMVTTNDDVLADKVRLYRGQGVSPHKRYWFDVVGYNYRMMNLAAAIGLAQIERGSSPGATPADCRALRCAARIAFGVRPEPGRSVMGTAG